MASPDPPPTKPVPIHAAWERRTQRFTVIFDQLLVPGLLNVDNWTFKHSGWIWQTEDANASGPAVKGGGRIQSPSGVGPSVTYSPPPADVRSLDLLYADAFSNFPVLLY